MRVKGQKSGVMRIFQALLVSYIITGILLLVLAVLLYKLNLDKGKVTAGITGIYVVSAFAGGFLIGKLQKVRKFCLLYTSPSPRDRSLSRMPSSA